MKAATYNTYIILDKRRKKTDNTYPLKLRVIVDRRSFHISLKLNVLEKHWKADKEQISTACKTIPNITKENLRLATTKMNALSILAELDEHEQLSFMGSDEIKAAILGQKTSSKKQTTLFGFAEEIIAQMKQAGKVGNARVYSMVLGSIKNFVKDKDLPLRKINFSWLKKYEAWYLSRTNVHGKPNTPNGLSVNMRTLRALYNRAIKSKLVPKDSYPFTDYKITSEKTRKRAIGNDDIEKLKTVVAQTSRQERAKDYFFISFYLMGASFVDVAFLKMSDIVDGRIEYKRRKTGRLHSIKITTALQTLLAKYKEGKKPEDYILNIVKGDTEEKRYASTRDELRRYNRSLKELANMAGITAHVTSYTARHSFATIAKYKGASTAVISEALGHESEEVTQVYLDSFDKSVLDSFNEMVLGE